MSDATALPAISAQQADGEPVERWLPVIGYEGLYEVSDLGRVKSVARWSIGGRWLDERIRKTPPRSKTSKGIPYVSVVLSRAKMKKTYAVHALVAEAFIGPRPEGMQVRHRDDDPSHPALSNLEYGTPAENMADMLRRGRNACASKTHCKRGHEFTPENTYRRPGAPTERNCRTCMRIWEAARVGTRKEQMKAWREAAKRR